MAKRPLQDRFFEAAKSEYKTEQLLPVKNLIYFGIIYPQKFVCSSDPVRVIMFTLGTLFINELIYGFVFRLIQNKYFGYLEKNFSESCRATLGNMPRSDIKLSRLIWQSIQTCKSSNSPSISESASVTDLSHKLRSIHLANAIH